MTANNAKETLTTNTAQNNHFMISVFQSSNVLYTSASLRQIKCKICY